MSKAKPHEWEALRDELWQELRADAKVLAPELFGKGLPDAEELSEREFVDRAVKNWSDPYFRQGLADLWAPVDPMTGERDYEGMKTLREFYAKNIAPRIEMGEIIPQQLPPPVDPAMMAPTEGVV